LESMQGAVEEQEGKLKKIKEKCCMLTLSI
jgi:hypothetical protein